MYFVRLKSKTLNFDLIKVTCRPQNKSQGTLSLVQYRYGGIYGHYMPLVSEVSSAGQTDESMTSARAAVKPANKSFCLEMLKRDVRKHSNSIHTISYFT